MSDDLVEEENPDIAGQWFRSIVLSGLQRLVALSLPNTPPSETIEATAEVWIETLWAQPIGWDEEEDAKRLQQAFIKVCGTAEKRFPAPRAIITSMPRRTSPEHLPLLEQAISPEQACKNVERMHKIVKELVENAPLSPLEQQQKEEREERAKQVDEFRKDYWSPAKVKRRGEIKAELEKMGVPV